MQKFKKNNGITLIALIITIIVMLILVGVTINVALNGGLFEKAKNASVQTQREADREELIVAMIGAYNNEGSFKISNAISDLPEDVKWCGAEDTTYSETDETTPDAETWEGSWVITKNNNKFYIDSDGTVLDEEPNIWVKRGLNINKAKLGKTYEFDAITYNEKEYSFEITFYNDGSLGWNNGVDGLTTVPENQYATLKSISYVLCDGNTFSLMEGDMATTEYLYITIVFNGNTATAYISETLGGTSETYITTGTTN